MPFIDRVDAAHKLAKKLLHYKNDPNVIVIGLPRGGIPMAQIIADELQVPFDLTVPRKIGHPQHCEYALGALTECGIIYWCPEFLSHGKQQYNLTTDHPAVQRIIEEEKAEAKRRKTVYRQGMPELNVANKTAIIVDDGIATGATMQAAILSLRKLNVGKVVAAVPIGAADAVHSLLKSCDEVVCISIPQHFGAVGAHYEHFDATSDEEVKACMRHAGIHNRYYTQSNNQSNNQGNDQCMKDYGGVTKEDEIRSAMQTNEYLSGKHL